MVERETSMYQNTVRTARAAVLSYSYMFCFVYHAFTVCFLFRFCFFLFLFFGDVACSECVCTITVFSLYGKYVVFFSFRMIVFFYLVTTGWIFDISLCENSINEKNPKYFEYDFQDKIQNTAPT